MKANMFKTIVEAVGGTLGIQQGIRWMAGKFGKKGPTAAEEAAERTAAQAARVTEDYDKLIAETRAKLPDATLLERKHWESLIENTERSKTIHLNTLSATKETIQKKDNLVRNAALGLASVGVVAGGIGVAKDYIAPSKYLTPAHSGSRADSPQGVDANGDPVPANNDDADSTGLGPNAPGLVGGFFQGLYRDFTGHGISAMSTAKGVAADTRGKQADAGKKVAEKNVAQAKAGFETSLYDTGAGIVKGSQPAVTSLGVGVVASVVNGLQQLIPGTTNPSPTTPPATDPNLLTAVSQPQGHGYSFIVRTDQTGDGFNIYFKDKKGFEVMAGLAPFPIITVPKSSSFSSVADVQQNFVARLESTPSTIDPAMGALSAYAKYLVVPKAEVTGSPQWDAVKDQFLNLLQGSDVVAREHAELLPNRAKDTQLASSLPSSAHSPNHKAATPPLSVAAVEPSDGPAPRDLQRKTVTPGVSLTG